MLVISQGCSRHRVSIPSQSPGAKAVGSGRQGNWPRIEQVAFAVPRTYDVQHASLIHSADGCRLGKVRSLLSSEWQGGIQDFEMSPDWDRLLVSCSPASAGDDNRRDLALVSLATGKTKVLRGDGEGYELLGWSSGGRLISYVSPTPVPCSLARDAGPAHYRLAAYTRNAGLGQPLHGPERVLYVSASDGSWRCKLQADVEAAVWLPGREALVYASDNEPHLVVWSVRGGRTALLPDEAGAGDLWVTPDGKRLLVSRGPALTLLEAPRNPSRLLDSKAWKTVATYDVPCEPDRVPAVEGLSSDGTMTALLWTAPDRFAVLNLLARKWAVYSLCRDIAWLQWSQDQRYLIAVLRRGGIGTPFDLAAVRVDPRSINHSGPIRWASPKRISPCIFLKMPTVTGLIKWKEAARP